MPSAKMCVLNSHEGEVQHSASSLFTKNKNNLLGQNDIK